MTGKIGHAWVRGSATALVATAMAFGVVPVVAAFAETSVEVNDSAQGGCRGDPRERYQSGRGTYRRGSLFLFGRGPRQR